MKYEQKYKLVCKNCKRDWTNSGCLGCTSNESIIVPSHIEVIIDKEDKIENISCSHCSMNVSSPCVCNNNLTP